MYRINQILLILVFAFSSYGASQAQTIVILNGVPTKVQLEGDKIISVLEEMPNYLDNYQNSASEIQYGNVNNAVEGALASTTTPVNTTAATQPTTVVTETSSKPKPAVETNTEPPMTDSAKSFTGNYFKFSGNSALLSELSINEIKDYAQKILNGEASSVTLESFYRANSTRSEQLVTNRLDACKKYFELSGVDPNLITINKVADKNQSNKVAVTLN